jgi:hypothetical protein
MAIIIPIAATNQMVDAVVIPVIPSSDLKMTPAPRNPTPVTIWAATRMGSLGGFAPVYTCQAMIEANVKRVDPAQMNMLVLSPAGLAAYSLSRPNRAPHSVDTASFEMTECSSKMTSSSPKVIQNQSVAAPVHSPSHRMPVLVRELSAATNRSRNAFNLHLHMILASWDSPRHNSRYNSRGPGRRVPLVLRH